MFDDGDEDEGPEPGVPADDDPWDERLLFREDPLSRAKVGRVRPFDQRLSDARPIRLVRTEAGDLLIMEGNHRIFAARLDGIESVRTLLCGLDEWRATFGPISRRRGNNNPGLHSCGGPMGWNDVRISLIPPGRRMVAQAHSTARTPSGKPLLILDTEPEPGPAAPQQELQGLRS